MRLEKLRQVDLNLLIFFAVIAEGKNVTRAAARLLCRRRANKFARRYLSATLRSQFQEDADRNKPWRGD
jgi:hypothetical protein